MDIIQYYSSQLKKYQDSPRAVSWGSKESQELRFKILCDIGNLRDKTILDYGCGLGDLYQFLKKYQIREYVGYDINQDMISGAIKKYPDGIFRNFIVLATYDYVFASGIFNLKTKDWQKETHKTIRKMWGICKIGMAINFLKANDLKRDKISYYAEPIEVLKFITTLTPKFVLRCDYKKNDFAIYLYK